MNKIEELIKLRIEEKIVKITPLQSGSDNQNWLLSTENGIKKYVLQRSNLQLDYIDSIDNLLSYLKDNNIPVYRLNSYWTEQQYTWIIKDYIEGRVLNKNSMSDMKQSLDVLKRLHSIRLPMCNNLFFSSVHDPLHWLVNPNKELMNFIAEARNTETAIKLMRYVKECLKMMSVEDYLNLPKAIIHGDFHGGNIIFQENKLKAIIDYDTVEISARITDMIYAWFSMCRAKKDRYKIDLINSNKFIEEFLINNAVTEKERQLCTYILILRLIPRGEYIKRLRGTQPERIDDYFEWVLSGIKGCSIFLKRNILF